MLTPKMIIDALGTITPPGQRQNIVAAGMVADATVRQGHVRVVVTTLSHDKALHQWLEAAVQKAATAVPGVTEVSVVLTAEKQSEPEPARRAVWNTEPLAHVKRVIAVASGKGGVGKSTTAVNLALALERMGKQVGLLDADIYGPSIPRMMGLKHKPEVVENKIIPLQAHGVRCMSMGLLTDEKQAVVWRGPQVSKALNQMLRSVQWATPNAPLDVLLIDMPPGTGDIHLSLVQQAPVSGAVIVTTPQEVAVADARKCIDMFRKVNVPILGVIENMNGFTDPTGQLHRIFGEGGGKALAAEAGAPLLGEVPIDMALREAADNGERYSDAGHIYQAIAAKL